MIEYLRGHALVLALLGAYVVFCLLVGWYFKRRAGRGVQEYYLARREIPGWVIALAFFSTFTSTNTYIGQAGKAFAAGLSWAWVGVFWTAFCILSWQVLGPRLRNQTASLRSLTIPDYFDFRYQSSLSTPIRALSALVILVATLPYMVGIAKGCAHLLTYTLALPYAWGAALLLFITCAYTVWGGMYSVLWTDAFQGILIFIVALVMVALPFAYVGGVGELFSRISDTQHPTATGEPMGDGLVTFCSLVSFTYVAGIGLAVGMKQIAEPRCLIRFYSIDNARSMKFAMTWTPVFLGVSLVAVMGLGALVHGMASPDEAEHLIQHTDEVVGFMLAKYGNPIVTGVCVAGLLAAGMSSLASVLLIVGTAVVNDLRNLRNPLPPTQTVRWTKAVMVVYSGLVLLVTVYPPAGIVELTAFSGAVFAASFFPALFGGLYLRWGTGHGAFASMLAGMGFCIFWKFAVRPSFPALREIHEILPSFLVSLATYLIISGWTRDRRPGRDHLAKLFDAGGAPEGHS